MVERRIRLGKPFSFEGCRFSRAIYDDTSPHVVSASQVGGTTWASRAFACLSGLNVGYPDQDRRPGVLEAQSAAGR
jgi:hypothetical protein